MNFRKDAVDAATFVVECAQATIGGKLPLVVERTPAFAAALELAELAAGELDDVATSVDAPSIESAIAVLAPWRGAHASIDRLILAAECYLAIEAGRSVTVAQLGALVGRGRASVFADLRRVGARREGKRIAAGAARRVVAQFRRESVFRSWAQTTKTGGIPMLQRLSDGAGGGRRAPRAKSSLAAARRRHCAAPRRRSAHGPPRRKKARCGPKGGAS